MILLLLLLVVFSYAQLPEPYVMLLEFRKTGDTNLGLKILELYPHAVFAEDLKVMLAQRFYEKGDTETASKLLRHVEPGKLKPDYREIYARLWKELQLDPKEALLKLPTFFVEYIPYVPLTDEEAVRVAQRLLDAGHTEAVIKLLKGRDLQKVCFLLGRAYYRKGQQEDAYQVLRSCPDPRAKEFLAKMLFEKSREEFLQALSTVEDKDVLNRILFYAGRMSLYDGRYEDALRWFSAMQESYNKYFQMGLVSFILERYQDAHLYFSKALKLAKSSVEISQAHFWLYKTLQKQGDSYSAHRHLRNASDGGGFYSVVARASLGEPVVDKFMQVILEDTQPPSTAFLVRSIWDAGFPYYARLEAFERLNSISPSDIILISRFDPYLAIRLAVRKYGERSEIYRAVAYPTPFREKVLQIAKEYGVDPALVYAVMRQESMFDPFAVSRSGAQGLMQVMPQTARYVASKEGLPLRPFDVEINLRMGVAYLREMLQLWNGDLVRALASYNAGPRKVSSWPQHRDVYVFIETIPFPETRDYVKQVLQNYYVYSSLLQ
ncbi:Lytic transglycosylase catalytic [Thermocrinis albus DSM 14484]|uniref:Lytic transglycosylase catalytic n=1 Tax=Thermocrinis albus (strain DSM 14484 / JCM 11386 / HI 11/12) TaxID=638303 RepID=D3SPL5_THEAH|nr:lytic transglycosylase domain-containing protein [Thermocrinis albus]ADC89102.1 Lytic transglycosylase catalytic [Thermocrinis albus DSM 14484]